ncbi:MAG: hypothetical protein NTW16_05770 [Bacteroidetes bacterium]|nr:hypothetical protein [Bacteroidota bacterium]
METVLTILVFALLVIPLWLFFSQLVWLFIKGIAEIWHNLLGFKGDETDYPSWLEKYRERNNIG